MSKRRCRRLSEGKSGSLEVSGTEEIQTRLILPDGDRFLTAQMVSQLNVPFQNGLLEVEKKLWTACLFFCNYRCYLI